ncbi:MAG: hypothetical protein MJ050_01340 [Phascolarctobacterium sp.]|nr:hypothetical protein [Phascolarctobacterium sp.]
MINFEFNIVSFLLGATVQPLFQALTHRYNYNKLYAETVSQSRMQWIDNFREEFSCFIGTAIYCKKVQFISKDVKAGNVLAAEQARVKLLTRLNQDVSKDGNEFNRAFADKLEQIDLYNPNSYSKDDLDKLVELSRAILEPEWKRVKEEAKGNKR